MDERPKIIDLFAGCGGFSLGAHLAGFDVALAVDIDPILSSSFPLNYPGVPLDHWNLAEADGGDFQGRLPGTRIAGIIGGPPCQAFSEIGRRSKTDERRDLVWHFFRIVAAMRPAFFVMENVRGLDFPENRELLDSAIDLVAGQYEIVGPVMLDAANFGAPTQRRRLFVFGFDRSEWDIPDLTDLKAKYSAAATVQEAISDLVAATPAQENLNGFDWWRYPADAAVSAYAAAARRPAPQGLGRGGMKGFFSGHARTRHTEAVVQRFATVLPGKQDAVGKHLRLDWQRQAPTLRAGTGSDRGSYQSVRPIHPSEDRVITVREGARLQGFPDWFVFHPTIWHSFRMIGNSVSPSVSKAVLSWIAGERAEGSVYLDAAE
jgi:DNA (cytosine-5)-methyltransferase 1